MNEQDYERGYRSAWTHVMREACRHLGGDDPSANAERWRIERAETVAKLREVCEDHGDNDWPDTLHLADVIEKHLYRHLEAK